MHGGNIRPSQLPCDEHLQELRASGLSDETIRAAHIYNADNNQIAKVLGRSNVLPWGGGIVYPYLDADGNDTGYARVKPKVPRTSDGKPVKYESVVGQANRAYFPPGFDKKADVLLMTEGEKKALAAQQAGFQCVGLTGTWGWQKKREDESRPREFIDDLDDLQWDARKVFIVFDSDAAEKPSVQHAECELAAALRAKGAEVRIVRLPGRPEGKVGLDDFLVEHGNLGPLQLCRLINSARVPRAWGKKDYEQPAHKHLAIDFLDSRYLHPDGYALRYWRGQFWAWSGTAYASSPDDRIKADVGRWLQCRLKDRTSKRVAEIIECIKDHVIVDDHLDEPSWLPGCKRTTADLVSMQNGMLDITALLDGKDAELVPHTPLRFSTSVLPYGYDRDATCPRWLQFVQEIFNGDDDLAQLLQEWFGYVITDDTSMHAILLLAGPPRTGKSTTLRVMEQLVGSENIVAFSMTRLANRFACSEFVGKRLAICSDAELNDRTGQQVLEQLKSISGEDSVQIDRKFKSLVSCRLKTRIAIGANQYPRFNDPSNALATRLLILPYAVRFEGREDRDLSAKLEAELPGMFNWAIEGLRRLRCNGSFTRPRRSQDALDDYKRLTSPLHSFIEETCETGPGKSIETREFYDAYSIWCVDKDIEAMSHETIGRQMRALGFHKARPNVKGRRVRVYQGIANREKSREPKP